MNLTRAFVLAAGVSCLALSTTPALAQSISNEELLERLERLEQQNRELRQEVEELRAETDLIRVPETSVEAAATNETGFVSTNVDYSFRVLDHAEDVNTKPVLQLQARQDDELTSALTLSGQVIAIANYQNSNTDDKFGYLMRNPTSANQIGGDVSEALIHSANIAVTAQVNDWITAYIEMLYAPEQNFGSGTIVATTRN